MDESLVHIDDRPIFNAIGNLVVLERSINRAMGRNMALLPYDKPEYYSKSKYAVVGDVKKELQNWDKNQIIARQKCVCKILIDLLSNN